MRHILDMISASSDVDPTEVALLRKALLLTERERTRRVGERKLKRMAEQQDSPLAPIALCGLMESHLWSSEFKDAFFWAQEIGGRYPMSPAAIWCSSLLVSMYRMLGMRRERFEADRERLRMVRAMAFQSQNPVNRVYALAELLREYEARDLAKDTESYQQELEKIAGPSEAISSSELPDLG